MSLATRNMGSQPVRITRPSGAAVMPKRGRDIDVRRAGEHRDLVRELPAALGPGRPLDKETRRTFEPLFAHDLSRVRIHDDKEAERFASSRGARAMTLGSHIVLAPGAYAPQSASGKKLVAHELAHTVQLGHLAPTLDAPTTSENAPLERDADRAAAHAVRGERVPPLARATAPVIARLPDGYKSKGDREAEVQFGKKVVSAIADFSWSDVKAAFY